jgi:hypothetical protein
VFLGSGLLFLAMLFASSATAAGLVAISGAGRRADDDGAVRQALLLSLAKTYGVRDGCGVHDLVGHHLAQDRLMRRWLIVITYVVAVALLLLGDLSCGSRSPFRRGVFISSACWRWSGPV